MSSQASLAIAPATVETVRPRPLGYRRFKPRRETAPGEAVPMTAHDRLVACALAVFPGSTLVD